VHRFAFAMAASESKPLEDRVRADVERFGAASVLDQPLVSYGDGNCTDEQWTSFISGHLSGMDPLRPFLSALYLYLSILMTVRSGYFKKKDREGKRKKLPSVEVELVSPSGAFGMAAVDMSGVHSMDTFVMAPVKWLGTGEEALLNQIILPRQERGSYHNATAASNELRTRAHMYAVFKYLVGAGVPYTSLSQHLRAVRYDAFGTQPFNIPVTLLAQEHTTNMVHCIGAWSQCT
jgi:hypothetical protein